GDSGWHSGIKSLVRLAASTPAQRATSAIGPFGPFPLHATSRSPAGKRRSARAIAMRWLGAFLPTSTMRERSPSGPEWTWLSRERERFVRAERLAMEGREWGPFGSGVDTGAPKRPAAPRSCQRPNPGSILDYAASGPGPLNSAHATPYPSP